MVLCFVLGYPKTGVGSMSGMMLSVGHGRCLNVPSCFGEWVNAIKSKPSLYRPP